MWLIAIIFVYVTGSSTIDIRLLSVEDICKQINNQICKREWFIINNDLMHNSTEKIQITIISFLYC